MSTFDEFAANVNLATHMLLIGDTKSGKTDYCAQAAIAGYELIYVDNDNGAGTLLEVLKAHPEAQKRVHYFKPVDMCKFMVALLEKDIFRYDESRGVEFSSTKADENTKIISMIPSKIPPNTILCLDSWTTLAHSALQMKATQHDVSLTDIERYSRELYGGAGFMATQIAQMMQHIPFHCIVQAHPGVYERKESPQGISSTILEKDMIIKETTQIPISTSAKHGKSIGKYFNQIGWLGLNNRGTHELDFTNQPGRIGGGTPNGKGDPRGAYSFKNLFGATHKQALTNPDSGWIRNITLAEFKAEMGR